jgi:hypothetical protein
MVFSEQSTEVAGCAEEFDHRAAQFFDPSGADHGDEWWSIVAPIEHSLRGVFGSDWTTVAMQSSVQRVIGGIEKDSCPRNGAAWLGGQETTRLGSYREHRDLSTRSDRANREPFDAVLVGPVDSGHDQHPRRLPFIELGGSQVVVRAPDVRRPR